MTKPRNDHGTGLLAALGAFGIWGFLPLYFTLIGPQVSAWEVLSQRIIWAALVLAGYTVLSGRLPRLVAVFRQRKMLLALTASALCIGLNWIVFIWAVTHNHVLETSMGYYITPLLNVLMGLLFLGERLRPLQWLSVGLAAVGVTILVGAFGSIPWVALTLATAFGVYGLIRKQVPVDSTTGLLMETTLLVPVALSLLVWLYGRQQVTFLHGSTSMDLLLVGTGLLTVVPLLLFAVGARRLPLSTLGLLNYIAPTLQFLSAVLLLKEPFTHADAVTFAFIWTGLALYSFDLVRQRRRVGRIAVEVPEES
jgi:chloramphenicol-sensitive protein RarD